MASRGRAELAFALALFAGAACGGSTAAIGALDGGGEDGSSSRDGGADGTTSADGSDGSSALDAGGDASVKSPFCPPSPPASGAACTRANLTCEYGTSNDPLCNSTYECNGQVWTKGYDGTQCGFTGTNEPEVTSAGLSPSAVLRPAEVL